MRMKQQNLQSPRQSENSGRYEGIDALTRRALMALVDKVFIYEKHGVEVSFKYGDEYRRAREFLGKNADLLPLAQ